MGVEFHSCQQIHRECLVHQKQKIPDKILGVTHDQNLTRQFVWLAAVETKSKRWTEFPAAHVADSLVYSD